VRNKEDDPSCSSGLLSRRIVEFALQPELEECAERVGEGGGSEELSDVCVGEPKGSKGFLVDLRVGVVGER
jgi:hypothetical protein